MIRHTVLLSIFISISLLTAGDACAISKKNISAERLYLEEDYRAAAHECERLFGKDKRGESRNEIAYLAGLSYLKLKELSKSKKYFEYVLDNSDDLLLVDEAEMGLAAISKDMPSLKEPSFFSVQMGSFEKKRNAESLFRKFKRRKYTVRMVQEKDGGTTVYKIKIGKFKSRKDAVRFAKKLNKKGYQTAIVAY